MSLDSTDRSETQAAPDRTDPELSLTVVRYSDRPNRCTVAPPGLTGDARMSTWLSADQSAFVSLADRR